MNLESINELIEGKLIHRSKTEHSFEYGYASDLMSDILRVTNFSTAVMVTGLATVQAVRTAEIANISCVVIARDKKISNDMLELAKESDISLISTPLTLFEISARLFNQGIKPVY